MYSFNTSRKPSERGKRGSTIYLNPTQPENSVTGTTNSLQLVDEERIPFLDLVAQHQTVSQLPSDIRIPNFGDYISIYCHRPRITDDSIPECGGEGGGEESGL